MYPIVLFQWRNLNDPQCLMPILENGLRIQELTALDSFSSTRDFSILGAKGQDLLSSLNPLKISLV